MGGSASKCGYGHCIVLWTLYCVISDFINRHFRFLLMYLKDLQTLSMVSLLNSDIMCSPLNYLFVLCFSLWTPFAIIMILFGLVFQFIIGLFHVFSFIELQISTVVVKCWDIFLVFWPL